MDDNMGGLVERMNIRLDLEDDDLVTDMVLICKIAGADGTTSLGLTTSEGLSWIDELGLLQAALTAFNQGYYQLGGRMGHGDDDDD
jgi:hypothetical protein